MVRKKPTLKIDGYNDDQNNELIGNAIDSWLDKKWAEFGKWTARGIAAGAFGYTAYFLFTHGWIHK